MSNINTVEVDRKFLKKLVLTFLGACEQIDEVSVVEKAFEDAGEEVLVVATVEGLEITKEIILKGQEKYQKNFQEELTKFFTVVFKE